MGEGEWWDMMGWGGWVTVSVVSNTNNPAVSHSITMRSYSATMTYPMGAAVWPFSWPLQHTTSHYTTLRYHKTSHYSITQQYTASYIQCLIAFISIPQYNSNVPHGCCGVAFFLASLMV